MAQCDCAAGIDQAACTEALLPTLDAIRDAAVDAGLEYDADCAERQADWVGELGCAIPTLELFQQASCALNCPLYHGDAGPGEACQIVANRATSCAAGLDCVVGVCEDVCFNWRLSEGALCVGTTGVCVTGTHCNFGDTNRCVPTPELGEPCPENICLEFEWCNQAVLPEATCDSIGTVGDTCQSTQACDTGYCTNNVCAAYPIVGEPCSDQCAGDLYCQAGICTVKQGNGQVCDEFNLPCASNLSCTGDVCGPGQPFVCAFPF
jgi:hypothetical protein